MIELLQGRNIALIGMPGAGKSTVGLALAKMLAYDFLDTDALIQSREGRRLQEILDTGGLEEFLRIEERHILSLECHSTVIATGGSAVYSGKAMASLRASGFVIHLDLDLPLLAARLRDFGSRGVVIAPGQTLESLYEERQPLYRRRADASVDCAGLTDEQAAESILEAVQRLKDSL